MNFLCCEELGCNICIVLWRSMLTRYFVKARKTNVVQPKDQEFNPREKFPKEKTEPVPPLSEDTTNAELPHNSDSGGNARSDPNTRRPSVFPAFDDDRWNIFNQFGRRHKIDFVINDLISGLQLFNYGYRSHKMTRLTK